MAVTFRKIAKIIAIGVTYAARATALHEGMPWDDDDRRRRAQPRSGR